LIINKESLQPINLTELFSLLSNLENAVIKIENPVDPNNVFNFKIDSIQDQDGYFVFDVAVLNGFALGNLINETIYSFYFDIKNDSTSDPLKLDKSTYTGNAADLDNRIIELENANFPDAVLKHGEVVMVGTTATIDAGDFNWRLNQVEFLSTPAYSTTIDEATDGFYRSDLIVGDNTGNYHLEKGIEDEFTAPEPLVPEGMIKLSLIPVFGAIIGTPAILPNYDDKFLKRYKTTYKTAQPIFNLEPAEDDYNIIFNNTSNSEIRIYQNGHLGKFIKNGAIYPFKSKGSAIVTVVAVNGTVVVNAPNGLILNKNQQCYLIKDDYNEWTLINPRNLQNIDNTSDTNKPVSIAQQAAIDLKVDKVTGKGLSTEDYTTSEKNKLASIDATHYLPPLQTTVQLSALPQAGVSDKARVYVEADLSDYFYDTTATSGDIAPDDQVGGIGFWRKVAVGGETAASIKTKYESNADTNAFTNVLKAKLDSITEIFTTVLKTAYDSSVTWISTNGATVLGHIGSAHAPSNAQKNSDITKAEIEAKLTGEITTHTHPAAAQNLDITILKIGTNTTLNNTYNGKVILLTASCTLTLPNGLALGFNYSVKTRAGVTLTYALGGSIVLLDNVGTTMAEKLSHTIANTGVANEYLCVGNL